MGSRERDDKIMPVDTGVQRLRRASATVERMGPPHPDEWITGVHDLWPVDDTTERRLGVVSVPSSELEVEPVVHRELVRPASRLESGLKLATAVGLVAVVMVFFWDAFWQSASSLVFAQRWRAVQISVASTPVRGRVFVSDKPRGQTPLTVVEYCRGRTVRLRIEAEGHAIWAWHGVCPQKGGLSLQARLQPL